MKSLKKIILEKLIINKNISIREFSDEELRKDYAQVWGATTKKEKQEIADKYGISDIKIRPIQIGILDILRKNRKNKKEFTIDDINDFNKYDIPEKQFEKYLDQESNEFVEYLCEDYEKRCKKLQCVRKFGINGIFNSYNSSIADRYLINKYKKIKKYLEK